MWETILADHQHRPWPLPERRWRMRMLWDNLLFAHWPVPADALRSLIPPALTLDLFDGVAWVGVVPFQMSNVAIRGFPTHDAAFPELNVRTYVTVEGKPGVWFFSLDAASPLAVAVARRFFHLPYARARMAMERDGEWMHVRSVRQDEHFPPACFEARYRPLGPAEASAEGSLDAWLTERYALYSADAAGRLFRGDIHHCRWPLQPAEALIVTDTMAAAAGIALPNPPPLLHACHRLDVLAWEIEPVAEGRSTRQRSLWKGSRR